MTRGFLCESCACGTFMVSKKSFSGCKIFIPCVRISTSIIGR